MNERKNKFKNYKNNRQHLRSTIYVLGYTPNLTNFQFYNIVHYFFTITWYRSIHNIIFVNITLHIFFNFNFACILAVPGTRTTKIHFILSFAFPIIVLPVIPGILLQKLYPFSFSFHHQYRAKSRTGNGKTIDVPVQKIMLPNIFKNISRSIPH